jgi:hypothetical protein
MVQNPPLANSLELFLTIIFETVPDESNFLDIDFKLIPYLKPLSFISPTYSLKEINFY